ncbi:hypothetical protein [Paenibacillus apis]|uniref:Uncharacterized protein n=1 Tax=Paenibacillus apis TaxID=1792174 RepID=A0A920CQ35_9BACL|nr:hypothetical protein [Paenibacillus apis]GIO45058.1 hypothetical protein J41TS4_48160 [Paenibacillus apis]
MQTTTQQQIARSVTIGRTLIAGSAAGVISAIAANLLAWGIIAANDFEFEMLNGVSITLSAFFANVIGALIYRVWLKKSSRVVIYYAILSLAMAVLMTVNTASNPMEPHIGAVANPLHFAVALLSLVLIPKFMQRAAAAVSKKG